MPRVGCNSNYLARSGVLVVKKSMSRCDFNRKGDAMNKRIRKKRILFEHINTLGMVLVQALTTINEQNNEINELRSIVERNAQATNSRFDYLEKKVADKVSKKSWFSR